MLDDMRISEKLDNPVMIEWALDTLENLPMTALPERTTLALEWFHDLFLIRQIENNDLDLLRQLFRSLPTECFANVSTLMLERWLHWPGRLVAEATPHLVKFHPERLIGLFEQYLKNVETGEPLDFYRITALKRAALPDNKKHYSHVVEKLCTLILESSEDAFIKATTLSSMLSFADVLPVESLQSILDVSLKTEKDGEKDEDDNTDEKENLLKRLFSGLYGHSAYFELTLDRRQGISTQSIEEMSDLLRDDAPLDLFNQYLANDGSLTNLITILEQAQQPACRTFLTLIRPGNVLEKHLTNEMLFTTMLAACLHAYELADFDCADKDLDHTLSLLSIDLNWLPQFDQLITRLKAFPREKTAPSMIELLANTTMTYGGIHLVKAMGELQFEEFVPCLIDSLSEELGDFIHEAAKESLKSIGSKAQEALIKQWDMLDSSQRIFALSTISEIGGKLAADFAVNRFSNQFEEDTEHWCQLALAAPDCRMLDLLRPHLKRKQPWIDRTYYVLSRLLDRDDPLLEALEKRVLDENKMMKLRLESFEHGNFVKDSLSLKLRCPECGAINLYQVNGIVLSPSAKFDNSATLIADEISCLSCDKDVEFELTAEAHLGITAQLIAQMADKDSDLQASSLVRTYDCSLDGQVIPMADGLKITRQQLSRNPNDVKHWYMLGSLLLKLNRPKAAKAAFEKLLKIDPYIANVRLELAKLLIQQNDESKAFEMLEPIQANPASWKTMGSATHFNQELAGTFNLLRAKMARDDLPLMHPSSLATPVKMGRNEPCPCGSGKKYKKCCGA